MSGMKNTLGLFIVFMLTFKTGIYQTIGKKGSEHLINWLPASRGHILYYKATTDKVLDREDFGNIWIHC